MNTATTVLLVPHQECSLCSPLAPVPIECATAKGLPGSRSSGWSQHCFVGYDFGCAADAPPPRLPRSALLRKPRGCSGGAASSLLLRSSRLQPRSSGCRCRLP